MICAITGGLGFVGSTLADRILSMGHQVIIIDNLSHPALGTDYLRKKVEFYAMDIRDKVTWEIIRRCDIVFHLAAQVNIDSSIISPLSTADINCAGTLNVLEACRIYNVPKVVFASSSEIYGSAQTDRMNESHPLDPQSPYAASKAYGDRLCHSYNETYGMNIAMLRNFNIFGPRQRFTQAGDCYGAVIGIFTNLILHGQPPTIFGDGEQSRDYQYVSDAVDAYIMCMEKDIKGPLVVGTGRDIRINDIAKNLIDICGSSVRPIYVEPRAGEVRRLCADTTLAQSYGFRSKTNLREGLENYIKWFRKDILRE